MHYWVLLFEWNGLVRLVPCRLRVRDLSFPDSLRPWDLLTARSNVRNHATYPNLVLARSAQREITALKPRSSQFLARSDNTKTSLARVSASSAPMATLV